MRPGVVERCVCFDTSFEEWLKLRRANGWTMEQAAAHTGCGEGCGTCKPYLRVVAATGRTELPIMSYDEMLAYDPDGSGS
jgi:bacterioferritin-associated ferredoxin